MRLSVQPCMPADLDRAATYYGPEKGDLSTPLHDIAMPLNGSNDRERAEVSCALQKHLIANDSTTRMIKVVDTDNDDDIIALGRWNKYPRGAFEKVSVIKPPEDPNAFPASFNATFYFGMLNEMMSARYSWMGEGPFWVLTVIKTRAPLRRHGAGSLIIRWGLEQAARDEMPVFLDSTPGAVKLYEEHGFREVGRQRVDGSKYGAPGMELDVTRMKADPL